MPKRKAAGAGSDDDDGDEEYVPDLDDVKAARVDRHDDDGDTRPKGGSAIKAIPKKSSSKKPTAVTTKHTSANIWTRLEAAGFKRREAFFFSSGSGMCAAAAIVKGTLQWDGTAEMLDQPAKLASGESLVFCDVTDCDCEHEIKPTLRQLLNQPDYAGTDYEDGLEKATVRCTEENCGGAVYVTRMCQGKFEADEGKFHNHCTKCPGLGRCIGDYRTHHCERCGNHYFAGSMGTFRCERCGHRDGYDESEGEEDDDDEDDDDGGW